MVEVKAQYQAKCDSLSTTLLLCSASYLYLAKDPFTYISVLSLCDRPVCERTTQARVAALWRTRGCPDVSRSHKCVACFKSEDLMRWATCKDTMYCSK